MVSGKTTDALAKGDHGKRERLVAGQSRGLLHSCPSLIVAASGLAGEMAVAGRLPARLSPPRQRRATPRSAACRRAPTIELSRLPLRRGGAPMALPLTSRPRGARDIPAIAERRGSTPRGRWSPRPAPRAVGDGAVPGRQRFAAESCASPRIRFVLPPGPDVDLDPATDRTTLPRARVDSMLMPVMPRSSLAIVLAPRRVSAIAPATHARRAPATEGPKAPKICEASSAMTVC
jgi:hypothetical protein